MRKARRNVILVATLALAAAAFAAPADEAAAKTRAQAAAKAWLAKVDGGDYAGSWDDAAALFKKAVTRDSWQQMLGASRSPLGAVRSRQLRGAEYRTRLPGAPDGEYVVIQFDTVFEHKAEAVETITPMLDADGHWRVSGYYIR
jgi:hypothetical protein